MFNFIKNYIKSLFLETEIGQMKCSKCGTTHSTALNACPERTAKAWDKYTPPPENITPEWVTDTIRGAATPPVVKDGDTISINIVEEPMVVVEEKPVKLKKSKKSTSKKKGTKTGKKKVK